MSTVAAIPSSARVHSGRGRSDSASLIRQRTPQGGANPQPSVGQRSYSFHSRQQQQQHQQQQSQDRYYEYQHKEKELRTALSDDYEEIDSDDGSYHSEGDDIAQYWDPYLYQLQQQAPRPKKVICKKPVFERPPFYGSEYHGAITREETAMLLGKEEGNYLVRKGLSQSGTYSLSFVFGGNIRHYRLFFENGEHFVGETTFDEIEDLVADGLITLHMELNNVEEYLKNAQESKRLSKDSYGLGAGVDASAVSSEKSEPLPPPLPPRNRIMSPDHLSPIAEEVPRPQPREDYTNTVIKKKDLRQESSLYDYHYEKPHNFKIHTFLNMPWCDFCHNFLWGLRSQGYKCKDCGYVAHKQCKDCTGDDCAPTKQLVKRVYGVDLTTLLRVYSTKIPIVVKHCIEELESRGLGIEGIYRIPGKAMEILEIKKQFDSEINVNLGSYEDPHAIAGALKLYFRELPIPLIPFDSFDLVLIAARCATQEETLETVRVILTRIPPPHYNTLKFLMKHLYNVQRESKKNRMDSKNLAVVFAPSLMRPPANADQLTAMIKLPEQKKITELLISHYDVLFPALY